MKTLHLSIIAAFGLVSGAVFLLVPSASAHLVPPFTMQFDPNYTDPITHSLFTSDGKPFLTVSKSSELDIPLTIKNDGNAYGVPIYFHTTFGNNFTQAVMPQGISVQVTPDHIFLDGAKEQRVNVIVKTSQNAITGSYEQNIVARWVTPQMQQSVIGVITFGVTFSSQNIPPPLKQFRSGIPAGSVKCDNGLQLIIKAEDGTPACVKSDTAQKLAERGWNLPETYDSPSLVQFYFSTNSSVIHVGQTIGVDMGDNNTQPRPIKLPFSYGYSFRSSSLSPCDYGPYRIAVFKGNVTMEDLNNTEPLHFYQPGDYSCYPAPAKFWIFEPLNNTATLVCHLGMNCNDTRSNSHLSFNGYWDDKAHFHLLDKGNYTIFASDEWGHTTVHHFTVTNSTVSNGLQTSQIVPQCVSNIPHPYAIAGGPGLPLCPVASFQASGQIVNSTGFYGIYNYTKFPNTQNFVLESGHNATITYKISAGAIRSWASTTPSNEINLTNYVTLMHDAGMYNHPGVYVSVYPTSETIQQNGSAIITITLSASKNASYGTYWMQLPPGICFGGEEIVLTVTDCTGKK